MRDGLRLLQSILFVCLIATISLAQSPPELPRVIAKRGDVAPGAKQSGSTTNLIFDSVSAPAVTADGRRAVFVAYLTSELDSTVDLKSYWWAKLKENGFYDLSLAAMSGMEVTSSNQILDLDSFNDTSGVFPGTVAQIGLDTVTGKLAFVGGLVSSTNPEESETALFIADDLGVTLVTKKGPSGEFTKPRFEGDDVFPIEIGFKEFKFINDRLIFNSTTANSITFSQDTGVAIFENGELSFPVLSSEFNPNVFPDAGLHQLVSIERVGPIATNENGAIVHTITGRVPEAPDCSFNNKNVSLLRYRSPGQESFKTLSKIWDPLIDETRFTEKTFISDFREISLNKDNEVVAIASLGEFSGDPTLACPQGTPQFPVNKTALLHFKSVDQTPQETFPL